MKTASWTSILLTAALAGGGCSRTGQAGPAASGAAPRATVDARSAEARPPFEPPADGRLTTEQVEMYVAVRRHAQRTQGGATSAAALAEQIVGLTGSAVRAAADLGYGADELFWVSSRIAEATPVGVAGPGADLARVIDEATRAGRRGVQRVAAGQGASHADGTPSDEKGRAFNRALLERYRAELEALQAPRSLPAPGRPTKG